MSAVVYLAAPGGDVVDAMPEAAGRRGLVMARDAAPLAPEPGVLVVAGDVDPAELVLVVVWARTGNPMSAVVAIMIAKEGCFVMVACSP